MDLLKSISKPQYVFRPKQVVRRLWRQLLEPANPIVETVLPWGVKIRINSSEIIGKNIWHQGLYDIVVCEAIFRLANSGDTVIDAGANIGQMTGLMALKVGSSGTVMSFEPHPTVYKSLTHNIGLLESDKSMGRVESHEIALSDSDGEDYIYCGYHFPFNSGTAHFGNDGPQSGDQGILINKQRLDNFIKDRMISVMKIDVEGHELNVFEGAKQAFANKQIRNIIYEDFGSVRKELSRFLDDNGFRRFALGKRLTGPVLTDPEESLSTLSSYEAPNFIATLEPDKLLERFAKRGWKTLGV